MVTYDDIIKANDGLTGIDVKGKNYIMVPERVKAFRKLYPEGFIRTSLISLEDGVCVMQTKVGYYKEDGQEIVLGTGMAYEKEANGYINKTSYIENCETSAVGRALGFLALGIDGGGICSAEELANAISNQNQTAKVAVTPQKFDYRPVFKRIKEKLGLNDKEFANLRKELISKGVVADIPGAEMDATGWDALEIAMMKACGMDGIQGKT